MPPIQDAPEKSKKYVYTPFPCVRYRAVKPGEKDPNNDGYIGAKFNSPEELLESEEKGEGPWFNTPGLKNIERVTQKTVEDQTTMIEKLSADLAAANREIRQLYDQIANKDEQIAALSDIKEPPAPAPAPKAKNGK